MGKLALLLAFFLGLPALEGPTPSAGILLLNIVIITNR